MVLSDLPPAGGFLKHGSILIMFDDWKMNMKTNIALEPAACALRAVAPRRTFDFGFRQACHGLAMDVRNGRLFEKNQRKQIFLSQRKS